MSKSPESAGTGIPAADASPVVSFRGWSVIGGLQGRSERYEHVVHPDFSVCTVVVRCGDVSWLPWLRLWLQVALRASVRRSRAHSLSGVTTLSWWLATRPGSTRQRRRCATPSV